MKSLLIITALMAVVPVAKAAQFDCTVHLNAKDNSTFEAAFYGDTTRIGGRDEIIDQGFTLAGIPLRITVRFRVSEDNLMLSLSRSDNLDLAIYTYGTVRNSGENLMSVFTSQALSKNLPVGLSTVSCERR